MDIKSVDRSRRGKWVRRLLVALVMSALVLLGFLLIEHLRGHIALARYVRTLRAQGEKMTAREFLLPIPTGENGAPEVLARAKDLRPGQVLPKAQSSYELMRRSNKQTAAILFWTSENLPEAERASWEQVLRELPGGNAMAEFLKKELFCRWWRFAWLDQDQLRYLRYLQGLIALGREASRQKSLQKLQPLEDELVMRFQNHGAYDRLRYLARWPSVHSLEL